LNDLIQDDLLARYPEILGSLADCIQCDDGWLDLLDALFDEITRHCMRAGISLPRARQVKEKTGSLRCYLSSKDDFIAGLVQMAEEISGWICEVCGEAGVMDVQDNRVQVRCLRHGGRTEAERNRMTTIWRFDSTRPASVERRVPETTEEGAELWILDLLNEVADDFCVKQATEFRVNAVRGFDGLQFDAANADQRLEGMMAMTSAFWKRRSS
jgi:hypothetical protein